MIDDYTLEVCDMWFGLHSSDVPEFDRHAWTGSSGARWAFLTQLTGIPL